MQPLQSATRRYRKVIKQHHANTWPHESNEEKEVNCALEGCRNAALLRERFERIDQYGNAQQELFPDDLPFVRRKKSPWAAEFEGFSVEAGVHFGALDRVH